jgi:hypothetical protein
MNKELNYEFAENGGGEEIGFNDSVTTSFKGHIAYFLARESIQNIIDAAVKFPVRAEFQLSKIKASDLPRPEQLKEIFKACHDYFHNNPQSVSFFQRAYDAFAQNEKIPVLKVSDFNTKGLTGDDDDIEGDYYNFLKSSGASSKKRGSGGSFGLGKGAYFAASSFHTIFVSSIYNANECIFQGKMRLVTHLKNGVKYQSTGSFGYAGQKPVRDSDSVPTFFKRKDQGTDVHVIGFYGEDDWAEQITKSVLNNFWLAVSKGILEVVIGNQLINADNIKALMFKNFSEDDKDTEESPNPLPVFVAYNDENSKVVRESLPTLGQVSLHIFLKDNYYKKIGYFRKTGMEIQRRSHQIPIAYAGVFVCDNDEGNEILRVMENPQHNRWDPHNAREKTEELFEKAKKADKELKEFIRRSLKGLFEADNTKYLNVPGLEKYLYIASEDEERLAGLNENSGMNENISDVETGSEIGAENEQSKEIELAQPIRVVKQPRVIERGGKKKTGKGGRKGKGGDVTSQGGEESEKGLEGRVLLDVESRSFAVRETPTDTEHVVVVKGKPGMKFNLALSVGTEDSFEEIKIQKAESDTGKQLKTKNNRVYGLELDQIGKAKLKVKFEDNERYSLRITAYENR